MSKSHRRDPGPQVSPRVRSLLRQERAAVELDVTLRVVDNEVRIGLPKIAWEMYDKVPQETPVRYLPDAHALVVDLPDPEPDVQLSDFGE